MLILFTAVWLHILEPLEKMRREGDLVKMFPAYLSGEDLFGLTDPIVLRIVESVSITIFYWCLPVTDTSFWGDINPRHDHWAEFVPADHCKKGSRLNIALDCWLFPYLAAVIFFINSDIDKSGTI